MKRLVVGVLCAVMLSSFAGRVQAAPPDARYVPDQVLVQFRAGSTDAEQADALAWISANAREHVAGKPAERAELVLASIPVGTVEAAVARLASHPAVEFAEPNWIVTHATTLNDQYYTNGSLWGMYGDGTSPKNQFGSQAGEAWARGNTGSRDVYVGVIDEGIDLNHPDLAANIWTNQFDPVDGVDNDRNGYVDDTHGWDFVHNDNSIYDDAGDDHGTHVAGTVGAVGGNEIGVAGVSWNVTMISAKFLGPNGGAIDAAVKAVDYITKLKTERGLNIVATNNSWGWSSWGSGSSQALEDAIERANAAGILFIAAAGNGGGDGKADNTDNFPFYPASYTNSNIISVTAFDSAGNMPSWANFGKKSVDLGAPGVGIKSTLPGNSYGSYNGTSMATPHVTGGVALYASTHPEATASAIKNAILASTVATRSLSSKTVTSGRLNVSGY